MVKPATNWTRRRYKFRGVKMQQLQDSLLRVSDVTNATKLSRTTIWRLEQEGKFPKSVQISKGVIGWWKSSIDTWMDDLKSNSSHTAA